MKMEKIVAKSALALGDRVLVAFEQSVGVVVDLGSEWDRGVDVEINGVIYGADIRQIRKVS